MTGKMNLQDWQVESFIRGYLEAALWSSTDTINQGSEEEEIVSLDGYRWASGEVEKLHYDCTHFIKNNFNICKQYASKIDTSSDDEWAYMGYDFWLTRNGHGAGFWDRGLGDLGTELTKAAKVYGEVYVYLGDDELVYVG